MRAMVWLGVLPIVASTAVADPFDYMSGSVTGISTGGSGSFIDQSQSQGLFDDGLSTSATDSFVDAATGRDFSVFASSDLATGTLRLRNKGTGGPGGIAANSATDAYAMFLDTFTVHGSFSTPVVIPFSAHFEGTWNSSSTALSSQVQQFIGALSLSDLSIAFTEDDWFPQPSPPGAG